MDVTKSPGVLRVERAQRLQGAMQLTRPDRVPLMMSISYLLADMGGISKQELVEDPEKCQELLERAALEFQPDSIMGLLPSDPTPHLILGDRMTVWPDHGVGANTHFQFVESEFMKEDDYDAFLDDPTDWVIRTYLPRAFTALEPFSLLPPLNQFVSGSYFLGGLGGLVSGPLGEAFSTFGEALRAVAAHDELKKKNGRPVEGEDGNVAEASLCRGWPTDRRALSYDSAGSMGGWQGAQQRVDQWGWQPSGAGGPVRGDDRIRSRRGCRSIRCGQREVGSRSHLCQRDDRKGDGPDGVPAGCGCL